MPFSIDTAREYTIAAAGSASSNPEKYLTTSEQRAAALKALTEGNLRNAIVTGFGLSPTDSYVYHAIASVSLTQAQAAIDAGTSNGLCDWYTRGETWQPTRPTDADITAYTSLFASTTASPGNALKAFDANAKKDSLGASIAQHLLSQRYIASDSMALVPARLSKAATKKPLFNAYLEFWIWSCYALHWAGPERGTAGVSTSHAILPVLMHHFGCVVPSREALEVIRLVALDGKKGPADTVLDVGSGNGYWTYMLRAIGVDVVGVDNRQSEFRCGWIGDTIFTDGVQFLKSRAGAKGDVLLLVYPIVGAGFFRAMLDAYAGDRIVVVGTQCRNGYTAFQNELVDEWIARERPGWSMKLRIPVPAFAGKDEALYYFRRT